MQERIIQQNEILSAYMDGQDVDVNFAEILTNSRELTQKWAGYHTIRDVMQGDEIILGRDFSANMKMLLENEEIEPISSPKTEKPKGLLLSLKSLGVPVMQAGIAASVCLVAILGVNIFNANNEVAQIDQPVLKTLPFTNSIEVVSYNSPAHTQPTAEQLELQQRKINALLENHELRRRTNKKVTPVEEEQTTPNKESITDTQK